MKYYELEQIATYLSKFKKIILVRRVEDSVLEFVFDKNKSIYASLKRGSASWFMKDGHKRNKIYQAPFDVLLNKHFARATLLQVEVQKGNRIIIIKVQSGSQYKAQKYKLFLEFTGRNTNAIITDKDDIVLEALRHIDRRVSSRTVVIGDTLIPLAPREFNEQKVIIEDVPQYLKEIHKYLHVKELIRLKNQKKIVVAKKIQKLEMELEKLEDEESLKQKTAFYEEEGALVLANLHNIKPYQKLANVLDFEGKERVIALPKEAKTPQSAANMLYQYAKKMKQKVKHIHIQRENLEEKLEFAKKLFTLIDNAKDADEINVLAPKKQTSNKKRKKEDAYELFFLEGYKIMVGKSQKSNIALLKESKKNDIWFHLQNMPSSHVIIRTDKQQVPQNILEFAAKLCACFSTTQEGAYLVDFTIRNNVRIDEGSNVFYTDFKSIKIDTGVKAQK